MEPIPETVEALNELDPTDERGLIARLGRLAARAQDIVPDLLGVSVSQLEEGLTFTLVATAEEIAVLDAVQYATGGPCVDGAHTDQVLEFDNDDVLDEERWRLFAQATAAHTVRSTLTLPVLGDDGVAVGSVNLYAASGRAFVGHHDALTEIFGAWAAGAIANADLSFTTRRDAEATPDRVREQVVIDLAVGIVAVDLGVDVEVAEARLREAAARAGVRPGQLAREIVRGRQEDDAGGQ
jgi:GAF domain-containing protein